MKKITTKRGQVIAIGRIKVPKMTYFNYEIPLLSFIVIEKPDGSYVATCIHLQIDGYGKGNMKNAVRDMLYGVWYYMRQNFLNEQYKDFAWDSMEEAFKSGSRRHELWDAYHIYQLGLAKDGRSTDNHSALDKKIKSLQVKVRRLEAKNKGLKAENEWLEDAIGTVSDDMIIELKRVAA